MSTLTALKLVTAKKTQHVAPIVHKRNKLITKLHEQLQICESKARGEQFAPKRLKTVVNPTTGERVTVETVKRVKEWFWTTDTGKINLAVKYGAKTLPLNKKGANAVEVADGAELIAVLQQLKLAVANGEFDEAIKDTSAQTALGFAK